MGKILLLIFFGVLLYLVFTRAKRPPPGEKPPAEEAMIQCAYCRVHVPLSESLAVGDKNYCCEEHRRLGQG
ncbi:MAG: hypothetical protein A2045_04195 [Rhodocyclales bacterium GWA2_65_20]|nr:MAG: hypothetical protein A2045_04195 [Rhodocyclales bacterium GWA2_65_20]